MLPHFGRGLLVSGPCGALATLPSPSSANRHHLLTSSNTPQLLFVHRAANLSSSVSIGPCWIQENGIEVETKRGGPSATPFPKLGAAKYAGNCLHKRLREPDSQSVCLRYVCVPGCNALSTDHHTRRFGLKLQDLLGCAMSAGKELHPNAIDSSSEDDGPGRLGVNLATSQCQLEAVRRLHSSLDPERDYLERSACQTAAGRALWNHVIHDPLAEVFAGDVFLRGLQEKVRRDQDKKSRETAGVMMAVRTLWFDARLGEAVARFDAASSDHQVVLLGAGMDARAYRLRALKDCAVFEVDSAKALHFKEAILQAMAEAGEALPCLAARSVHRVAADIASEDWFTLLTAAGFNVHLPTVWILEGFLYYLHEARAKETLRCITQHSVGETVVLADFMNESSTHLAHELKTHFYFHSDWPEELLPMLGFSQVKVSQIGDPDANFGLINDELNLFHQMRRVSRHVKADVNGKPYMRLLLVETSADR